MWWLGLILLITFFTPFNFLATGLGGAYLGMEGNKIALSRRKFKNLDQFYKVQRVWKIVGFIVTPLGLLYSFAYLSFMVSAFGGRFYNPLSDSRIVYGVLQQIMQVLIVGLVMVLVIWGYRKMTINRLFREATATV
ncbi:hypothetical protein KGQ71_03460 [Patescibacteria group bacterium]|nr:hypothetical protein [Patescibacteria group bacterium]